MPYTAVSRSIWSSRKFRQLTDFEKLLYFYLLTNQAVTPLGIYRFHPGYALVDMDRDESEIPLITEALNRLQGIGLIQYDPGERLLRLVNFLTFHPPCGPKHAGALCNAVATLPPGPMKSQVSAELLRFEHVRSCSGAKKLNGTDTGRGTGMRTGMDTGGDTDPSRMRAQRDPTTPHHDHDHKNLLLKRIKNKKGGPAGNGEQAATAAKPTRRAGVPKSAGEHLASALKKLRPKTVVEPSNRTPLDGARGEVQARAHPLEAGDSP